MIVLYLSLLLDDVLVCLRFCWCPCMAINVSVQYDGGFLPDIVLLTQCYEWFKDWGGRGYDDFVPGEVTKTVTSGDETTWSPTWPASLPRIHRILQGGWSNMSPVGAIFVPFPPKTGTNMLHPRPPPIVELVLLPSGNPFKCHEEVLYFSYWSHLNVLTFFPPDWGMLRRSRCIQIFL